MAATDKFGIIKEIVGAIRNDTPPTVEDGDPAALRINSNSELLVSVSSSGTTQDANIEEIAGNAVATTGVSGSLPVDGTAEDNAAEDGSRVIRIGGTAFSVPQSYSNNDRVVLNSDLDGFFRILDKAFDTLSLANKVITLNTLATDKDPSGQIDADETNVAGSPGTSYYPSTAGRAYGTRTRRTWSLTLNDVTSCELEESDDGGTTWIPVTASLIDRGAGRMGFLATHFTAAAGSPVTFKVQLDQPSASERYRWKVITPDSTNDVLIVSFGRAL